MSFQVSSRWFFPCHQAWNADLTSAVQHLISTTHRLLNALPPARSPSPQSNCSCYTRYVYEYESNSSSASIIGSNDGSVLAWDAASGDVVASWKEHVGPVHNVRWNPVTAMFASTCSATIFWYVGSGHEAGHICMLYRRFPP